VHVSGSGSPPMAETGISDVEFPTSASRETAN
jgi:hypothetical protein